MQSADLPSQEAEHTVCEHREQEYNLHYTLCWPMVQTKIKIEKWRVLFHIG